MCIGYRKERILKRYYNFVYIYYYDIYLDDNKI